MLSRLCNHEKVLFQEIPVYKDTINFHKVLDELKLSAKYEDILVNMFKCYEKLVKEKILNKKELPLLKKWLKDINKIYPNLKN